MATEPNPKPEESILSSVKKVLGLDEGYEAFDLDITMFINSAFATLTQAGVGPDAGFEITDKADTWKSFTEDPRLNQVKTYIVLCVRNQFDPPATAYGIQSFEKVAQEYLWRLRLQADRS